MLASPRLTLAPDTCATISSPSFPLLAFMPSKTPAQHLSADGGVQTFNHHRRSSISPDVYMAPLPLPNGWHRCGVCLEYDAAKLEDYSASAIQKEIAALHTFEKKIEAIDSSALDALPAPQSDREILLNSIRSRLLTLEVIRTWEKNPDIYSSGITSASPVFVIMERPYALHRHPGSALPSSVKLMPQALLEARKRPQKSSASTPRSPSRRDRRRGQLLPERRPLRFLLRFRRRDRRRSQSCLRKIQRRCHRSPQVLRSMAQVRPPSALQRRLQAWRRDLRQEAPL